MQEKYKIYKGEKFGRLTVIKLDYIKEYKKYYKCRCDCGNIKSIEKMNILRGQVKSCGCLVKTLPRKNGVSLYGTKTYRVWVNMLNRCLNNNNPRYKNYGGRGISVSNEWLKFKNFYSDMGDKPDNLSIDRIDNDGNYCKENCKWSTAKQQARNTRKNVFIKYKGKKYYLTDLAKKLNIAVCTLKKRNSLGYDLTKLSPREERKPKIIDISNFEFTRVREDDMKRLRILGCTLEQVGNTYGITRERVRQILSK